MRRNLLWATPALAALLLAGPSASAQSVDAATDAAAGAGSATGSAETGASASGTADATSPSTASTDASGATDAAASTSGSTADTGAAADASANTSTPDSADAQAGAQSTISGDASIGADAQTATPPAPAQPNASADISANVDASADPNATAQPDNQAPESTDAGADASLQGNANLQAGGQAAARQNLNLQQGLQFGQATNRGLAINTIARDHFFFNSGLRQGDTLVSYAGRPIRSVADFNRWVIYQPGQRVPVVVLRDGRPQTIYVVYQQQHGIEHQAGYAPTGGGAYLGVTFDAQNPRQAIVRTVNPGSPAERAGVRPGDAIVAVNGRQVGGSQDVIRIVGSMQPGEPIDLAITRQVVLGSRPGVAQAAAYSPDVQLQGSVPPPQPVPTAPAPVASGAVTTGEYSAVDADAAVVPGSGRYDNTPARAGDADRDGRLLDADGRVGPVEGRAVLPRRRN